MARKRHGTRKHKRRRIIPIWKLLDRQLAPKQRLLRRKSLEAVSIGRREKVSPRKAAYQVGLTLERVIANTNAFRKKHGRWTVTKSDRIPRVLLIYERGRKTIVEVASSRTASTIGEYHNAVKQFLDTGKSSFLKEFRKKRFKDIHGKFHTLDTRPQAVFKIKAREPTPEFFDIYRR